MDRKSVTRWWSSLQKKEFSSGVFRVWLEGLTLSGLLDLTEGCGAETYLERCEQVTTDVSK